MTFSTYADLEVRVAEWLARDDLSAYIPDMITLFEAAACRKLKVRPMETTATIATTNGTGSLPTGYLGHRRLTWTGDPLTELIYLAPPVFKSKANVSSTAPPVFYTIEAGNVIIYPVDDTGVEMVYNAKTDAVSSSLNWLYTNHPDAYLFGTLAEANAFNKRIDAAALWKGRRDEVFNEIQMLDFNERNGMSVRVMGATP